MLRAALFRHGFLGLGLILLLLATAGCGNERPLNVVFIVADTLRADHTSLYGFERPTTPSLSRFASESVMFEQARAQAGCTFPSVNSLLTSRYPQRFLGRKGRQMGFLEGETTLATILRARGYATTAVSASPVVRNTPSEANRHGGFGAGFEVFDESCHRENAACVNARAEASLDSISEPFLLYLHYLDPHAPYRPPPSERSFAGDGKGLRRWVKIGDVGPVTAALYKGGNPVELRDEELRHFRDLYDDEITYLDSQLGELFEQLERRRLLDRTVIVFASDHGEELLDHEQFGHCRDHVFDTVLHTPLLLRIPGVEPGIVERPVQNLAVTPTVLDYLGIDPSTFAFEGRSLRPLFEGTGSPKPYVFAAQGRSRVVADARYKLVYDLVSDTVALYDIQNDPGETVDVSTHEPQEVERLFDVLGRWLETHEGSAVDSIEKADEVRRELEAVGYL